MQKIIASMLQYVILITLLVFIMVENALGNKNAKIVYSTKPKLFQEKMCSQ
jgi:hypothetical protein